MNSTKLIATLAAVGAAGILTNSSLAAGPATKIVRAQNIVFSPSHIEIRRGGRVEWKFLDAKLLSKHNVTSVGKLRFKSSQDMLTGTYTVRFSKAGTYHYMCMIHPASMSGVIVVR